MCNGKRFRKKNKKPTSEAEKTIILRGKSRCSVCIKITHERNEGIKKLARTTRVQ